MQNKDIQDISASFVKIAHHGGESGFHEETWKRNNPKKSTIGVITPYNKSKDFLPQPNDIQRLKPYMDKIGLTHISEFDSNLYKYYPKAVVDRLKLYTKTSIVCKESSNISFIRTRFNLDGNVTEQLVEPSAQWV